MFYPFYSLFISFLILGVPRCMNIVGICVSNVLSISMYAIFLIVSLMYTILASLFIYRYDISCLRVHPCTSMGYIALFQTPTWYPRCQLQTTKRGNSPSTSRTHSASSSQRDSTRNCRHNSHYLIGSSAFVVVLPQQRNDTQF